jgi:hypothetical protein
MYPIYPLMCMLSAFAFARLENIFTSVLSVCVSTVVVVGSAPRAPVKILEKKKPRVESSKNVLLPLLLLLSFGFVDCDDPEIHIFSTVQLSEAFATCLSL